MTRLPKIACSWCGNGPESGETTPPCVTCLAYAKGYIEASQTPADPIPRAELRYRTAVTALIAAKAEFKRARKKARKAGILK